MPDINLDKFRSIFPFLRKLNLILGINPGIIRTCLATPTGHTCGRIHLLDGQVEQLKTVWDQQWTLAWNDLIYSSIQGDGITETYGASKTFT